MEGGDPLCPSRNQGARLARQPASVEREIPNAGAFSWCPKKQSHGAREERVTEEKAGLLQIQTEAQGVEKRVWAWRGVGASKESQRQSRR